MAADLLDAIEGFLVATFVPAQLTWAGSGKLPPNLKMPFAVIGDVDETADWQEDGSAHPPYDDEGMLPIRVIANTKEACKALTLLIGSKFPAGLTLAPLTADDGSILMVRRVTRGSPVLEEDLAYAGEPSWVGHLIFATIESKTL